MLEGLPRGTHTLVCRVPPGQGGRGGLGLVERPLCPPPPSFSSSSVHLPITSPGVAGGAGGAQQERLPRESQLVGQPPPLPFRACRRQEAPRPAGPLLLQDLPCVHFGRGARCRRKGAWPSSARQALPWTAGKAASCSAGRGKAGAWTTGVAMATGLHLRGWEGWGGEREGQRSTSRAQREPDLSSRSGALSGSPQRQESLGRGRAWAQLRFRQPETPST